MLPSLLPDISIKYVNIYSSFRSHRLAHSFLILNHYLIFFWCSMLCQKLHTMHIPYIIMRHLFYFFSHSVPLYTPIINLPKLQLARCEFFLNVFFLNSRIAKFHDFYEEHFVLQGEMKDDDRAKKHINLMKYRDLKSIKWQHLNFNFSSPKQN